MVLVFHSDLKPDEWSLISQHDVLSFEISHDKPCCSRLPCYGEIDDVDLYAQQINDNYYIQILVFIQEGFNALMGNRFVGFKKLNLTLLFAVLGANIVVE